MLAFDTKKFTSEMNNIINYSLGYLEGVNKGKTEFLKNLGRDTIEIMKEFVDSNARVNPSALHHIYEWHRTGSPEARLFDIDYTISNLGLSFRSTFRQSSSVKAGSYVPFYDKARIMEQGIPVTIKPRNAKVLAFEADGEQVFTKNPVTVSSPGGDETTGAFERTLDTFINSYFSQAFFRSSGLQKYIESPTAYKKNLRAGARSGKMKGIETGYRWIANAKMRSA